jgi:hypothetical protein
MKQQPRNKHTEDDRASLLLLFGIGSPLLANIGKASTFHRERNKDLERG